MVGVTETDMALTADDLRKIKALMDDSEKNIEERLVGRMDVKFDELRGEMRDMRTGIVDDITDVINDSLGLVSEQISRLDKRIDSLRIVAGD